MSVLLTQGRNLSDNRSAGLHRSPIRANSSTSAGGEDLPLYARRHPQNEPTGRAERTGVTIEGILCELPKRGGKVMRATITTYKGSSPFLDLREWYVDNAGEWKAGKGCTVSADLIADLHGALGHWLADCALRK